MLITIILHSALKNSVPGNADRIRIDYGGNITIRTFLSQYNIHPGQIGLVLVNKEIYDLDRPLEDGTTVELYPIFGGG